MDYYNDLAIATNSDFDVSSLTVNKLRLYYGELLPLVSPHDAIVPTEDMNVIYDQVQSSNKDKEVFNFEHHSSIKANRNVKRSIKEDLNE